MTQYEARPPIQEAPRSGLAPSVHDEAKRVRILSKVERIRFEPSRYATLIRPDIGPPRFKPLGPAPGPPHKWWFNGTEGRWEPYRQTDGITRYVEDAVRLREERHRNRWYRRLARRMGVRS